jgi:hypothetical protein
MTDQLNTLCVKVKVMEEQYAQLYKKVDKLDEDKVESEVCTIRTEQLDKVTTKVDRLIWAIALWVVVYIIKQVSAFGG